MPKLEQYPTLQLASFSNDWDLLKTKIDMSTNYQAAGIWYDTYLFLSKYSD